MPTDNYPAWLAEWMAEKDIVLWGAADLREFSTPRGDKGEKLPSALSWAVPMNPGIMASIRKGPNRRYADEYARVNRLINDLSA